MDISPVPTEKIHADEIMQRYPGVKPFTTRHGVLRWRYRKKGRDISLPLPAGTAAFDEAYRSAVAAVEQGTVIRLKARRSHTNPDGVRGAFPACIDRVLRQTRMRARSFGREFDLNHDWMIKKLEEQDYRCHLTGLPFMPQGGKRNPFAPSIDRIDNRYGYVPDNARLVLTSVNLALNDFGLSHFDVMCAARVSYVTGRTRIGQAER